jgi:hypothetical protein
VKPLKQPQEAVAEIGNGAIGDDDILLGEQLGADLFALQIPQVARQTDLYDEIVTIPLSRGNQAGELLGDQHRMGAVAAAALTDLPGHKGARSHGHDTPPLALLCLHRLTAERAVLGLGNEIDTGDVLLSARRRPHHLRCRPPCKAGMMAEQSQQFVAPPFLPTSSRSYRVKM